MLPKEGICWGYMPEHVIRKDVENGALVRLDMPELKRESERLYAIYRTDTPPGPAGSWLISRFSAQATAAPEPSISSPSFPSCAIDEKDRRGTRE
jgi:DNA-binding transcriptional LysR family regulator